MPYRVMTKEELYRSNWSSGRNRFGQDVWFNRAHWTFQFPFGFEGQPVTEVDGEYKVRGVWVPYQALVWINETRSENDPDYLYGIPGDLYKRWGSQPCDHDFINMGFMHVKMVCKHCNAEQ